MSRAESTVNIQKLPRKSLQPVILDRTSLLAKETSCSSSLTLSQSPLHKWREVCVKLFRETHRERETCLFCLLDKPNQFQKTFNHHVENIWGWQKTSWVSLVAWSHPCAFSSFVGFGDDWQNLTQSFRWFSLYLSKDVFFLAFSWHSSPL